MAKYKIIPSSRTIVQSPISIGHKAEKGVEAIEFDLTAWVETYGSGTATIVMKRWGDSIPYPVALEIDENNKATWTLSDTDTAKAGMAYAQLSYIVGDEVVKKSDIYTFRVMDSLTGEGEPPEAYDSWLEHLTHLAAEAMAEVLDIDGIVTDKTLTVDGGIADGKATGDALSALEDAVTEETDKLKADLVNLCSVSRNITTLTSFEDGYFSHDSLYRRTGGKIATIPMKAGATYNITATGTHNKFSIATCNDNTSSLVTIYGRRNGEVSTTNNHSYQNTENYSYLIVWVYYGSDTFNCTLTIEEVVGNQNNLEISGISVYNRAQIDSIVNDAKSEVIDENISYKDIFTGSLVNKVVLNDVIVNEDRGRAFMWTANPGKYYKAYATGNNRMIVFGSEDGTTYTEITRIATSDISVRNELAFQMGSYTYGFIQLYYSANDIPSGTFDFKLIESATNNFTDFEVARIRVYTKEQMDEQMDAFAENLIKDKYALRAENIKLAHSSLAGASKNLSLVAVKCISRQGEVPNYEAYLYMNEVNRKFYVSYNVPDNPVYLFDWDDSLANGNALRYWHPTITADGDIIFLMYRSKQNPIIYPHEDYTSPYVVDFGSNRKPYGWLVNSSVVQLEDGSFCFGDYAAHSLADEQNDDRRIIWKVSKPYNVVSNWVQAHSFKHVYIGSSYSDEPSNEIGHIHAIMFDHYDGYMYCTTGDIDRHCRMWISTDNGETWAAVDGAVGTTEDTVAQARGQKWRMTNAIFTANAMWWGTDAQSPDHKLWKCTRDANGHIDFSTLTEVADIEVFGLLSNESQRTYITALYRNPDGLLLIDRGEPRGDKLNLSFYSFADGKIYVVSEYKRASNTVGNIESPNRIGLPMQCTTQYMPQCANGILTGGGTYIRGNNTDIFNNSLNDYVGALKLVLY